MSDVNMLILIANILVLALSLKLYTEFFKEIAQRNRVKAGKESKE